MEMVPVPFLLHFLLLSTMFWRVIHVSLFVHSFFGASLVALKKKDEGTSIRPIAVGCTLHRLVTKCAGSKVMKKIDELLFPKQLGYGIKRGIEIAIHSARVYLSNLSHDHKLDFKNAFNTIHRDKMLLAVKDLAPSLLPFVHSVYCSSSSLFCGTEIIQSSEGVQQVSQLMCIMTSS